MVDEQTLLEQTIKFEIDFFTYIAGCTEFEVLSLPYDYATGKELTVQEITDISLDCERRGVKLLYRTSLGDHKTALVYSADMDIIGMVSDLEPDGFAC